VSPNIHPTAIIDRGAELADDVTVGPGAIIGPGCVIGAGSKIAAHAVLERNVKLGVGVKVGIGSVLGGDPQDLKWKGEDTSVEIGDRTVLREYLTINRATSHSWKTTVGKDCFLMSYVHLAHDCQVGDGVIISNASQFAGHIIIEDKVIVSGLCAAHQFVKIGRQCFVGGCSRISKDVPPYVKAVGNPVKLYGLNTIGLQRSGMPEESMHALKQTYRLCFNSEYNLAQGVEKARKEVEQLPEVKHFLSFVEESARGVII
jgi:UDP-N-acetylglucosamine acyltransferase